VTAPPGKPPAAANALPGAKPLPVAPAAPAPQGKPPTPAPVLGKPSSVAPAAPAALPGAPGGDAGRKAACHGHRCSRRKAAASRAQHRDSLVESFRQRLLAEKAPVVVTPPPGAKPPAATPSSIVKPLPKPPDPRLRQSEFGSETGRQSSFHGAGGSANSHARYRSRAFPRRRRSSMPRCHHHWFAHRPPLFMRRHRR
jgi:hypothetical protein